MKSRIRSALAAAVALPILLAPLGVGALPGCTPREPAPAPADDDEPIRLNDDGTVSTVAGTGAGGFSGDGGRSVEARLSSPLDVTLAVDGALLIADFGNDRVRRIDLSTGRISTVAGAGVAATEPPLGPTGVTPLSDGAFLVVAWRENRVYRYDAGGSRTLLAGDGTTACADDPADAPAVLRALVAPRSADLLADRSVLVSEQGCHRVRRIRPDGSVTTYAGTGLPGYTGDGDAAVLGTLQAGSVAEGPSFGLALSPEDPPDELFVADTLNHVVRVVKPFTGRLETYAGSGEPGMVDGTPELARFSRPVHVFSPRDHSVWVVDAGNHAVRYVDPLRTSVRTVIGTGVGGFNGDGLPPRQTQLDNPTAVYVTDDGLVFVADAGNHRIRAFRFSAP